MTEELKDIRKDLSKKLKKERFEHTIGVMYTASSLAMCYDEDIQKALTAGLLHDCGKYCSSKDQIKLCRKYKISLTDSELEMPALIHAKLGAYLARHEYKIEDQDIIDAITYHTTGRPGMTLLEKIIYIADYIEPNRKKFDGLETARKLAYEDLDKAMKYILESTIEYVKERNRNLHPYSIKALEYYSKKA